MEAIRVQEYGDAEVLQPEEIPEPVPGEGEARVRVEAAGVNFIDIYHRKGLYPNPTPFTPGGEGAGIVDKVGSGVTAVRPGDRVAYAAGLGSYAQYAIVPAMQLVPIPDDVTNLQAAAVMLQGMTAHYLSHSTYPLNEGDVALVHAAAGGVGRLLVQMAKMRGATVLGTVSTEEKADLAREAGADHAIRYTEVDFEEETQRLTGGKGVHVVYDSVGKDTFAKSLNCLRPRGYIVLYGQSSGPVEPFDPKILNRRGSLFLTRPSLGHYTATQEELLQRAIDLFQWIATGSLDVRVDQTFPLAKAADAHRYMEARKTKGKLLLIP